MHVTSRTTQFALVAVAGALAIAGCSSSGSSGSNPSASSSKSAAGLSKAQFVAQADAVCKSFDTKRKALPTPAAATDFAAVTANIQGTLDLVPVFLTQSKALVARSADKDELTSKWISVEQSDFTATAPLARAVLAASKAKNAAAVQQAVTKLSAAPDHSPQIATFMTGYGLTDCATLEST
jgi:hypothetical protein